MKIKKAIPAQVQPVVSLSFDVFMSLLFAVMLSDEKHCQDAWRASIPFLPEEVKRHLSKKVSGLKKFMDIVFKANSTIDRIIISNVLVDRRNEFD